MISIIVPAYNEEKYIANCIKSLQNQTTKNSYEIIVVNNNSTDSTKAIATNTGVKVVDELKRAPAFAKNAGAKVALGNVLLFIDADFVLQNNFLQNLENYFATHPYVTAVGGPMVYKDGGLLIYFATAILKYFYFFHKLVRLISGYQTLSGGNIAVKKDAFEKIGGFDTRFSHILLPEDLDFCLRLGRAGYKVNFSNKLWALSSFRRYRNKLNTDVFARTGATIKLLRGF